MRRYVDGVEVDLDESGASIEPLGDRLIVRSERGTHTAAVVRDGEAALVSYLGRQYRIERRPARAAYAVSGASGEIRAPMPGQVVDVRAAQGQAVEKGAVLLVVEAMKTQQPFVAPFKGVVKSLNVAKGSQVAEGDLLAEVREGT